MANGKTNAMRILDAKKIEYEMHTYENKDGKIDGVSVAEKIGRDPEVVFKTLVSQGASKQIYVFVIPVQAELDLKKAAKAAGEKGRDDCGKGYSKAYRLYPRRLFPCRDEKAVSNVYTS